MAGRARGEQTKLLANALDRASTACFTVGIATPAAGYVYNVGNFRASVEFIAVAGGMVGWISAALALHFIARWVLLDLDDE